MDHLSGTLDALGRLFVYPDEHTIQTAELLYVVLQAELPEAAEDAAQFGAFVEQCEQWEMEEAFTRTFDVNPACALEIGWHLFGEEYARGMFLVRMRGELRKYGLLESVELPDHVSHVLAVLAAMPDEEAGRFVHACVAPAVRKMNAALAETDSPYRHIVACLAATLQHAWAESSQSTDENPGWNRAGEGSTGDDPLRAYPVREEGCGGESCCGGHGEFVPLDISHPSAEGIGARGGCSTPFDETGNAESVPEGHRTERADAKAGEEQ